MSNRTIANLDHELQQSNDRRCFNIFLLECEPGKTWAPLIQDDWSAWLREVGVVEDANHESPGSIPGSMVLWYKTKHKNLWYQETYQNAVRSARWLCWYIIDVGSAFRIDDLALEGEKFLTQFIIRPDEPGYTGRAEAEQSFRTRFDDYSLRFHYGYLEFCGRTVSNADYVRRAVSGEDTQLCEGGAVFGTPKT